MRAIREDDEKAVAAAIVALSESRRIFAPLVFTVSAFAMHFQGLRLLFSNWRLTLVLVAAIALVTAGAFYLNAVFAFVISQPGHQKTIRQWFALSLGIVIAVMMLTYVTVPARIVGIKPTGSRRDKTAAAVVGGTLGGAVKAIKMSAKLAAGNVSPKATESPAPGGA